MLEKIVFYGFYIFGVLLFLDFLILLKIQNTLKSKYPEVWRHLGEPEQFTFSNDVIIKQTVMSEYIKKKDYLSLNDPKFTIQCKVLSYLHRISIFYLAIYFILFFIWIAK